MTVTFDPVREAKKLRKQFISDKTRLLLLFGSGTSRAAGMHSIAELTTIVRDDLPEAQRTDFSALLSKCENGASLEHVLSKIHGLLELFSDQTGVIANGFSVSRITVLRDAICKSILRHLNKEPSGSLEAHSQFAAWLGSVRRTEPIEIFSTNYDLLFERGFELAEVPYFDGFIGAISPSFSEALVEMSASASGWTRLWKLRGSINWRCSVDRATGRRKVIRILGDPSSDDREIVISPYWENYIRSHRMPFAAYHNRLRHQTAIGDCSLIIVGYGFDSEYLNDIIFGALRTNRDLSVTVLLYDLLDKKYLQRQLIGPVEGLTNIAIYSPKMAIVGGVAGEWATPLTLPAGRRSWPFWNSERLQFTLGDFSNMPLFLREFVGTGASFEEYQ